MSQWWAGLTCCRDYGAVVYTSLALRGHNVDSGWSRLGKNFWHNFQHSVRTLVGFLTNRHNCTSNSPSKGKTLEIFFIDFFFRSGTDFSRWQIIQRLNWQLREVSSTQDKKCFDKSFSQCYGKILSLTLKVASMDYDKFARLIVEQFSLIFSTLAPSLCSVCQ